MLLNGQNYDQCHTNGTPPVPTFKYEYKEGSANAAGGEKGEEMKGEREVAEKAEQVPLINKAKARHRLNGKRSAITGKADSCQGLL